MIFRINSLYVHLEKRESLSYFWSLTLPKAEKRKYRFLDCCEDWILIWDAIVWSKLTWNTWKGAPDIIYYLNSCNSLVEWLSPKQKRTSDSHLNLPKCYQVLLQDTKAQFLPVDGLNVLHGGRLHLYANVINCVKLFGDCLYSGKAQYKQNAFTNLEKELKQHGTTLAS